MCDYSLHHVASRPAKVGDKLVTTQFNNSITRGFAAVGEPNVAVCLLPGTEVAFEKEIEFERGFGLFSSWKREKTIGDKVARFRQVNTDKPNVHHDALEFPNGEIALVTRLYEGQHATVLQLPASPHSRAGEVRCRPRLGNEKQLVGRQRGGLTSKIHMVVEPGPTALVICAGSQLSRLRQAGSNSTLAARL
jgi:hypothetical protein